MFLGCSLYCVIIIIKYWWGMQHCFRFRLKITSCAWFFGSRLKLIFNWKAHLFIFTKSLFNSKAELLLSWITEKKFQLSANSLTFEGNPSDKLLIYIKNNIIDQVLRPGEHLLYRPVIRLYHLINPYTFYFTKDLV